MRRTPTTATLAATAFGFPESSVEGVQGTKKAHATLHGKPLTSAEQKKRLQRFVWVDRLAGALGDPEFRHALLQEGFRFLQWAPIRTEIRKNGELIGAKQWDVSVPEAGFMRVERRLQTGKDLTLEPPEHWLGLHVIDSTAGGTESVRPSRH